jgi:hypothetical protein
MAQVPSLHLPPNTWQSRPSLQQWEVASQQLVYSAVFFLFLYLIEHNALALDSYLRRSSIQ